MMDSSQFGSQGWSWNNINNAGSDDDSDSLPILPPNTSTVSTAGPSTTRDSSHKFTIPPQPGQDNLEEDGTDGDQDRQEEEDYGDDDDDDDEWEKSSSEIASISSEELHETRPNRWRGNASTWRHWTKADRDVWTSIERVRMSDLGVHLYNAFALKRDARAEIARMKAEVKRTSKSKENGKGKGKLREEKGEGSSVVPRSGQKEMMDEGESEDLDWGEHGEGSGDEKEMPWAPPRSWTAWPNYERGYERLGNGELMAGIGERFAGETIRRRKDLTETLPGHNLAEEISASILRGVKERFYERRTRRRMQEEVTGSGHEEEEEVMESVETDISERRPGSRARSVSRSRNISNGTGDVSDTGKLSGEEPPTLRGRTTPGGGQSAPKRKRSPSYEPTLMADDELAYEMVRPATIQIMRKLDDALTLLHNSWAATLRFKMGDDDDNNDGDYDDGVDGGSDGAGLNSDVDMYVVDTDGAETDQTSAPQTPRTARRVGRPRKATPATYEKPRSESRRGRPRKIHVPLEGETEQEMLIRIARQQKRRIPDSYFENSSTAPSRSRSRSAASGGRSKSRPRMAGAGDEDETGNRGRRRRQSLVSQDSRPSSVAPPGTPSGRDHRRWIERCKPRDWRDVIGAAAMAGFEPDVIARATQRCATLFGQEMTIHTLHEVPITDPLKDGVETTKYMPGRVGGGHEHDESQGRSYEIGSLPPPTPGKAKGATGWAAGGPHKCPQLGCRMAVTGFSRPWNLKRHMQKQHPGVAIPTLVRTRSKRSLRADTGSDDESEAEQRARGDGRGRVESDLDELGGAAHVDGFLQPIEIGQERSRNRRRAVSQRAREVVESYNSGQDDDGKLESENETEDW